MNNFDSEDRESGRDRRDGFRRRGGDDVEFGYADNGQGLRTRRPPRGANNFGRGGRPFQNPRSSLGFPPSQFRPYDNQAYPMYEGRGRGWGRGQRYPRGGGGYMRNRNPQDTYYNEKFQGGNRPPPDVGVGYGPGQEGRRRRRPNGGMRRYDNSNENENIGYERKRYGDNAIGGRYRRGRRGRGQIRNNNNNNNNNGYGRGPYNNRGGGQGRRANRRYPFNSGRRGQRRNQRGGNQRTGRPEEKKVPFLNETLQVESMSEVRSEIEDNKKEKPETTIPNSGQFTLHYWDAPVIENLPPLEEK